MADPRAPIFLANEPGKKFYEVEALLGRRWSARHNAYEYLVKWERWPHADNSWELESRLKYCQEFKADYDRVHPRTKRTAPLTSVMAKKKSTTTDGAAKQSLKVQSKTTAKSLPEPPKKPSITVVFGKPKFSGATSQTHTDNVGTLPNPAQGEDQPHPNEGGPLLDLSEPPNLTSTYTQPATSADDPASAEPQPSTSSQMPGPSTSQAQLSPDSSSSSSSSSESLDLSESSDSNEL